MAAKNGEPHLFVVCGAAGTGKTTFARRLVRCLGAAALVDIDPCVDIMLAKGLEGFGLPYNDRDSDRYKSIFRDAIHKQLFSIAKEQLSYSQIPVVLVAPFTTERRWSALDFARWILQEARDENRCERQLLTILFLRCEPHERIRRIRHRNLQRDAYKFVDETGYSQSTEDPIGTPILSQGKTNEALPLVASLDGTSNAVVLVINTESEKSLLLGLQQCYDRATNALSSPSHL
jgi:hypothetical protein